MSRQILTTKKTFGSPDRNYIFNLKKNNMPCFV